MKPSLRARRNPESRRTPQVLSTETGSHSLNTLFKRALLSVCILGFSSGTAFADDTLTILHINNLHSRIESANRFYST